VVKESKQNYGKVEEKKKKENAVTRQMQLQGSLETREMGVKESFRVGVQW